MFAPPPTYSKVLKLVLGFLLLLGLGSCEKEEFLPSFDEVETITDHTPHGNASTGIDGVSSSMMEISPEHKDAIRAYVIGEEKGGEEVKSLLDLWLARPVMYVYDSIRSLRVATVYVENDDPLLMTNLVFVFDGNQLAYGQLIRYQMDEDYRERLSWDQESLRNFSGSATVSSLNGLQEVLEGSKGGDCFTIEVLNQVLNFGAPGTVVSSNPGPGTTDDAVVTIGTITNDNTGTGGLPGQHDLEFCYETRVGEATGHVYLVRVDCVTRLVVNDIVIVREAEQGSATQKNGEKTDCGELIRTLGIHTGYLSPDWTSAQEQAWESAMAGTSFVYNTAARAIIDLNQLQSCTGGANACARQQLAAYGNSLLNDHFGNTLHAGIGTNLSDQQLMDVVEALFVAGLNGNQAIFEAVNVSVLNINHGFVAEDIGLAISAFSSMYVSNPESFRFNAATWLTFSAKAGRTLNENTTNWLVVNPQVVSRLNQPDIASDVSADLAEIYAGLYQNNSEFKDLADGEFAGIPPFVWIFVKEIGVQVAIEIIKKRIPGFAQYEDIIQAVYDVSQGDITGFLGEVLEISKTTIVQALGVSNPISIALTLTVDGIEFGGQASRAWKAVSKLSAFGSEAIEKLLFVVASRGNGLLGKIAYRNNRVGIELKDVGSASDFVDDFVVKLRESFPVTGPISAPPNPNLTYSVGRNPELFKIIFQPNSNTTGAPSIGLKLPSGYQVKLRF